MFPLWRSYTNDHLTFMTFAMLLLYIILIDLKLNLTMQQKIEWCYVWKRVSIRCDISFASFIDNFNAAIISGRLFFHSRSNTFTVNWTKHSYKRHVIGFVVASYVDFFFADAFIRFFLFKSNSLFLLLLFPLSIVPVADYCCWLSHFFGSAAVDCILSFCCTHLYSHF